MKDSFKNKLYTNEIIVYRNHSWGYEKNADGALFSGHHRTKIMAKDLPEWYIFGRYYKCWGYLSVKGITDLVYVPNMTFNHFLKDDYLFIAYGGVIKETESTEYGYVRKIHSGFDERVWGSEILEVLKGARRFSNYDITGIIQQIKEKKDWLINKYPNEFGPDRLSFDVDEYFAENKNNTEV